MRYTRYTRNPGIARVLAGMGWVRELNEDVGRIYDEIQAFFLRDPSYSESNDAAVLLTLENNIATRVMRRQGADPQEELGPAVEVLTDYELAAVRYVYSNGRVKVADLVAEFGRSDKFARKVLRGLEGRQLLVWHGSNSRDPFQYYPLS